jgi:hypothetical protein
LIGHEPKNNALQDRSPWNLLKSPNTIEIR